MSKDKRKAGNLLSQRQKILADLLEGKTITSMDAFEKYHITRLSAVIFDIKKAGYPVTTEIEKGQYADGTSSRFARYSILPEDRDWATQKFNNGISVSVTDLPPTSKII